MIWFLIESGVALLLLIFIVWWTMPARKRHRHPDDAGPSD
jgi:hypothetical protein